MSGADLTFFKVIDGSFLQVREVDLWTMFRLSELAWPPNVCRLVGVEGFDGAYLELAFPRFSHQFIYYVFSQEVAVIFSLFYASFILEVSKLVNEVFVGGIDIVILAFLGSLGDFLLSPYVLYELDCVERSVEIFMQVVSSQIPSQLLSASFDCV